MCVVRMDIENCVDYWKKAGVFKGNITFECIGDFIHYKYHKFTASDHNNVSTQ